VTDPRRYWPQTTRDELRDLVIDWFYKPQSRSYATDAIYDMIWIRFQSSDFMARLFTEWKDAVLQSTVVLDAHDANGTDQRVYKAWKELSKAIATYSLRRKPA
jgi:hypothetical protein